MTVLVGIYSFWGMVGLPEDAKFLNEGERKQVLARLEADREGQNTHYSPEFVKQGFMDWKSYLFAVIYLGQYQEQSTRSSYGRLIRLFNST